MNESTVIPAVQLDDVTFSYPQALVGQECAPVLLHASMTVPEGAFALLEGDTGSGKTTLMRLVKPEVTPAGELSGTVRVLGRDVRTLDTVTSATQIGFVFQSPENQIVCDTVWHELAFGLENIGADEQDMRLRIAETCQFLGMEGFFRKHCHELSGGQRQLVALASVLVMRPRVLLLDEPTSQLDPVAEKDFLALLFRVNRELGVTVIVATHRPEPMIPYATCAYRLFSGRIHPVTMGNAPRMTTVAEGVVPNVTAPAAGSALALGDVWFRYTRDADWVLRGCDFSVGQGEVRALMGGNGSGKSTLLALAAGVEKPRRGRAKRPLASSQALLPQAPRALLACETVEEELLEWSRAAGYGAAEVDEALGRLRLANARSRHPYDLSQGQQQLLALEKLLLTKPALLLLDEPTKGLDARARSATITRITEAAATGTTVVVATHDVGFVRDACQTVSLLFDGQTVLTCDVAAFLAASWVYGDTR